MHNSWFQSFNDMCEKGSTIYSDSWRAYVRSLTAQGYNHYPCAVSICDRAVSLLWSIWRGIISITSAVWSSSRLSTRAVTFHALYVTLGNIIRKHGVSFHCYADDTQLYISSRPGETHQIEKLMECIVDIKNWMTSNFLLLNSEKTEVLISDLKPPTSNNLEHCLTLDGCSVNSLVISQEPRWCYLIVISPLTATFLAL